MMKTRKKGSLTVELAIVLPMVLLIMVAMLQLCITKYQNIVTTTAAMQAAARGAAYWDKLGGSGAWDFQVAGANGSGHGEMVAANFSEHDPYRYLIDTNSSNRSSNVASYAKWLVNQNVDIQETTTNDPVVKKTGGLLQKYITVSVTKKYVNPLGRTFEKLGIYQPAQNTVTASAPLNTPTEFIRTAAFLYDVAKNKLGGAHFK